MHETGLKLISFNLSFKENLILSFELLSHLSDHGTHLVTLEVKMSVSVFLHQLHLLFLNLRCNRKLHESLSNSRRQKLWAKNTARQAAYRRRKNCSRSR